MTATRVWDVACVIAALIGLPSFIGGALVNMAGNRLLMRSVEFPLGDVQSVDVDAQGNIVLALCFYGRIQLYDASGRFRRSWSAEALGGSFTVSFRSPDMVASYASRRRSTVLYNLVGDRMHEEPETDSQTAQTGTGWVDAPDGARVTVHRRLFWPTVVREKAGLSQTIIAEPWRFRLVEGPLPAWLLLVGGGLLNRKTLTRIRARRRHAGQMQRTGDPPSKK